MLWVRRAWSPVLSRSDQSRGVSAVAEKAGAQALTTKFLGVLASNRRLFALPDMIDAFLTELARRRGEVAAEVTSAVALSDDEVQAVTDALKQDAGLGISLLGVR